MSLRLMGASVCQTSIKLPGRPSFCDTPIHSIGFCSPMRFIQKSAEERVCAWSFEMGLALPSGCQEYCSGVRPAMTWSSQSNASPTCIRSIIEFFIVRFLSSYRTARSLSRAAEAEHHLGDAAHLNLLRAFRDPVSPVVAVDVLEGHVARVADAAVHLDRLVRRVTHKPVRAVVAHRHFVADLHVVLEVQLPGRLADELPHHLTLGLQLYQRPLDGLAARQRLSKRDPLPRVLHRLVDAVLGSAHAGRS